MAITLPDSENLSVNDLLENDVFYNLIYRVLQAEPSGFSSRAGQRFQELRKLGQLRRPSSGSTDERLVFHDKNLKCLESVRIEDITIAPEVATELSGWLNDPMSFFQPQEPRQDVKVTSREMLAVFQYHSARATRQQSIVSRIRSRIWDLVYFRQSEFFGNVDWIEGASSQIDSRSVRQWRDNGRRWDNLAESLGGYGSLLRLPWDIPDSA